MPRKSGSQKRKLVKKKDKKQKNMENNIKDDIDQKKPPKFKFVCQLCGECCGSEVITVTISDLARWVEDKTIYRVMHLLELVEENGAYKIVLKKDEDGKCNLYHRDNKKCTIYETCPMFCQAFPLGYNGEQYILKNRNCIGLGNEGITKEQLKSIRDSAFDEFIALRQTYGVLPVLYGIVFSKLITDSKAFMEKISDAENIGDLGDLGDIVVDNENNEKGEKEIEKEEEKK